MVSIHRVPAIVYLIIREICFIFRFKRGADSQFPESRFAKTLVRKKATTHAIIIPDNMTKGEKRVLVLK